MDAGGNINSGFWFLTSGFWLSVQRKQFQAAGCVKQFGSPAMRLRGGFDVAQHGADVNRLAVIAAVIFAELLHAENFTQRREDAKKFFATYFQWSADGLR